MFRRYNPTEGRWISPDPAGVGAVDPPNPQSWNRYAYVMNDPLALTDPLGLGQCPGVCIVEGTPGPPNPNPGGSICWGQGYFILLGFVACLPPANLGYFFSGTFMPNGPSGGPNGRGGANTSTFRLVTKSDYCAGGDRNILYWLVDTSTGGIPSSNWWVTEHVQASVPTNSGGTNDIPNQYLDLLSNGGTPYNLLQSFTASQGSGAPSYPVYVNIGGQDYGTLGIWMSNNPSKERTALAKISELPAAIGEGLRL